MRDDYWRLRRDQALVIAQLAVWSLISSGNWRAAAAASVRRMMMLVPGLQGTVDVRQSAHGYTVHEKTDRRKKNKAARRLTGVCRSCTRFSNHQRRSTRIEPGIPAAMAATLAAAFLIGPFKKTFSAGRTTMSYRKAASPPAGHVNQQAARWCMNMHMGYGMVLSPSAPDSVPAMELCSYTRRREQHIACSLQQTRLGETYSCPIPCTAPATGLACFQRHEAHINAAEEILFLLPACRVERRDPCSSNGRMRKAMVGGRVSRAHLSVICAAQPCDVLGVGELMGTACKELADGDVWWASYRRIAGTETLPAQLGGWPLPVSSPSWSTGLFL
nr:unnamed protein product [Digitaria exilis]